MSHAARPSDPTASRILLLKDRSAMLSAARAFFLNREVLEVDSLHGLKELLSEGLGDIYQIGHTSREDSSTKVEWYRCEFTLEQLVAETASFIEVFLGPQPCTILTYRAAMQTYAGIDYTKADRAHLLQSLKRHGIEIDPSHEEDLLNILYSTIVKPQLGRRQLTAVVDFVEEGVVATKRFKFYHEGNELANGSQEINPEKCCGVTVEFDQLMKARIFSPQESTREHKRR